MHDNYKHEITLNEIANYVGMTPAHFSKYFKDKTEETFSKYLRRVRLEHAIDDLRNKKITVRLSGVDPEKYYTVTDMDSRQSKIYQGKELTSQLPLILEKPHSSLLLKYKVTNEKPNKE